MVFSRIDVDVSTLGAFQLGGHELEFTSSQVNLGLKFTTDLAESQTIMAKDRNGTAKRRLDALSPCVENTVIPLVHRLPLIRSVYFPALMYGCEVWGNVDRREPEWSPERLKPIHDARALTLLITGYPPGKIKLPTLSFYLPPVAVVPVLRDLGLHSGFSFTRAMGVRQMIKYRYSYLKSYESKFGNSVALPPPSPPTSPRPPRLASAPARPPRCLLADLTPSSLFILDNKPSTTQPPPAGRTSDERRVDRR